MLTYADMQVNKLLPSLSTPDRASAEDNSGDNDPKAEFPLSRNAIAARIEEMELEIQGACYMYEALSH